MSVLQYGMGWPGIITRGSWVLAARLLLPAGFAEPQADFAQGSEEIGRKEISRTSGMVPKRLGELEEDYGSARATVFPLPSQPVWQGAGGGSVWQTPAMWLAVPWVSPAGSPTH